MSSTSYAHIYGQLDQTSERLPEDLEHLFSLGLVCDASIGFTQAARFRAPLRELQARGGLLAPNVYPRDCDPACHDANWWTYSTEECERLLRIARERYAALDLGPLLAINTYTPGNGFVAACRRLGIHYLLGFCAPTVIEDGGWSISHYGSPLSPYFVADDDYRKPEDPGARPDSLMMLSMELRNPMTCLHHWSEGPWCPLNAQAADRWLEPSGTPYPFLAIAEDWLRQTELTGVPRFFHINLQYFFAGRCREHNRAALTWLAAQRDAGRLEIGGIRPWEARMRAQTGFVRQTTYWRGEMMGMHVGHRPGSVADVIVDESRARQVIWQYPAPAPQRWYDFQPPWNYPQFEPHGHAPASEDSSGLSVTTTPVGSTATSLTWTVTIHNTGATRAVPLALWEVLTNCRGPFTATVTGAPGLRAEVLPHPAGVGGAVLLDGSWAAGPTIVTLRLGFAAATPNPYRRRWGHLLEAQTFMYDGKPYTVLATQTPDPVQVRGRVTAGGVRYERLCGIDYTAGEVPPTGLTIVFDGTRLAGWYRFWGITADQLELEGVDAEEARLRQTTAALVARVRPATQVPEPGYQLFGDLTDPARWDRPLARAAGEAELAQVTSWFRTQRPEAGEAVIGVHPGLYIPRGSITKVLGHEFDLISCKAGYGFTELCADYPQGWDWGVAGWVQWRHLGVSFTGLDDGAAYTLHVHACDPERRVLDLRIHLFDLDAGPANKLDVCVVRDWRVPAGLDGRWQPAALCSAPIPPICRTWKRVGAWINPLEAGHLHDWVAERGAPGLFMHLWVTRQA